MAKNLEDLVITLTLDGKQYEASLKSAEKKTQDLAKTTNKGAEQSGGLMKALQSGWAAAAAGVAVVVAAVKQFVQTMREMAKEYVTQYEAELKVVQALKARGDYTKQNLQELKDWATQMQLSSGIADDQAMSLYALARQTGLNNEQAKEAVVLASDIAKNLGIDANTAMKGLTKAMQGQSGMLDRYLPQLAQMRKAGASNEEIFQRLKAQFGGFTQNMFEQTGKLGQLQMAWGDFREAIGGISVEFLKLEDADDKATKGLASFTDWLENNKSKLAAIMKFLKDVVINVLSPKVIIDMFKFLTKGIIELGKNIGYLIANVFKIIVANVKVVWLQGVDDLFTALKERSPKLFDFLGGGDQWAKNFSALQQAKEELKNLKLIALSPAASWEMIKPDQIKIFEEFLENWNKIDSVLPDIDQKITGATESAGELSEEAKKLQALLLRIDKYILSGAKRFDRWKMTASDLASAFSAIAKTITEEIGGAFAGVADAMVDLGAAALSGNWLGAITAAVGLLKKAVNYTKEVKKEMREAFASQYESWQGRATRARDLGYDAITGETYTNEDYLIALKRQAEWAKNGVIEGTVAVEDYYDILLEIRSVEEDITAEKKEQLEAIKTQREEKRQAYLEELQQKMNLGRIDAENWAQAERVAKGLISQGYTGSELTTALSGLGITSRSFGNMVTIGTVETNVYEAGIDSALTAMGANVSRALGA